MEGNRLMFGLLLLVALCAVVAIIISAVTLNRPSSVPTITLNGLGGGQSPPIVVGGGGGGGSGGQSGAGRVYTIAIGHDWGAHEYLDEKNFVQGFNKDIILEVCEHAGIDCRVVWDSTVNCWKSIPGDHSMGGQGIFDRWYDACAGWQGTAGRVQVFDFGLPYLKRSVVYFFIKKGKTFDPTNIKGKIIGAIDGWAADEKCIARQDKIKGNVLPEYTMKYFAQGRELAESLHNDTVDAAFGDAVILNQYMAVKGSVFERINSTTFSCAIQGHSIMTRKDNDLITFWNRGFKKMKESGRFQALCEEAKTKHGHQGTLLPCADY